MQHFKESSKDKKKPKVTLKQAFKTIIWPRRNLVFIGLILIVIRSLSGLILPWQSKILLDDVVPNKDFDQLKTLIVVVLGAILVQAVTSFLFKVSIANASTLAIESCNCARLSNSAASGLLKYDHTNKVANINKKPII